MPDPLFPQRISGSRRCLAATYSPFPSKHMDAWPGGIAIGRMSHLRGMGSLRYWFQLQIITIYRYTYRYKHKIVEWSPQADWQCVGFMAWAVVDDHALTSGLCILRGYKYIIGQQGASSPSRHNGTGFFTVKAVKRQETDVMMDSLFVVGTPILLGSDPGMYSQSGRDFYPLNMWELGATL